MSTPQIKTFKGIKVVQLESSDYVGEALNSATEQEIATADIVIDGDRVVKNRVSGMGFTKPVDTMKNFKGLTLEPEYAFRQIAILIEAGMIFSVTDIEDCFDLSDCIFQQAKLYAQAAHDYAMENKK